MFNGVVQKNVSIKDDYMQLVKRLVSEVSEAKDNYCEIIELI